MKNIFITGGAGFIGSNFIPYFLEKYPDYKIINFDKLTYAGNLNNLAEVSKNKRYEFIHGDICNRSIVEKVFAAHEIQGVIHFAAESHVDNSIAGPDAFINTNVVGTFNVIDVARKAWLDAPFKIKNNYQSAKFHHISTDEVYGSLPQEGFFKEETPYAPNSPYSASKASSDLIVRSYHHTYGMNVITTNCSNNYGPKQHDEKLIPTIMRNALALKSIPIYGDGQNIRDWLYVIDHCYGVDLAFHQGKSGHTYNIGGRNERTNIVIANKICDILDQKRPRADKKSYKELITYVQDRPGHDRRYAIDASKIESELGWKAIENFETGIVKTVSWYLSKSNQSN